MFAFEGKELLYTFYDPSTAGLLLQGPVSDCLLTVYPVHIHLILSLCSLLSRESWAKASLSSDTRDSLSLSLSSNILQFS
jgi:hypothetical protein